MVSINTNYPLMLNYNKTSYIEFTNYSLIDTPSFKYATSYTASDIKFPFEYLDYSGQNTKFANINYYSTDGNLITTPIDMVINKNALTEIANYYKKQSGYMIATPSEISQFEYMNNYADLFDVLKYLKVLNDTIIPRARLRSKYEDFSQTSANDSNFNMDHRFSSLYNDKVVDDNYDDYYCKGIYRLRPERSDVYISKNRLIKDGKYCILPLFSLKNIADYESIMSYLVIRGMRIPMKKVILSKSGSTARVAFIWPEYMFNEKIDYINSISYIEIASTTVFSNTPVFYDINASQNKVVDNSYITNANFNKMVSSKLLYNYGYYGYSSIDELSNIRDISLYSNNSKY